MLCGPRTSAGVCSILCPISRSAATVLPGMRPSTPSASG